MKRSTFETVLALCLVTAIAGVTGPVAEAAVYGLPEGATSPGLDEARSRAVFGAGGEAASFTAAAPVLLASAAGALGTPLKRGQASWYGPRFHGRPTANGETYDQEAMTAAMTGVPLGITVRVVRRDTGAAVVVRVNDRGPYERKNGRWVPHRSRVIDLSRAAMRRLGGIDDGIIPVTVYRVR